MTRVINKKYWTTTELAKELDMRSAQKLNNLLHLAGFQYRVNGTWVTYSKFSKMGLIKLGEEKIGDDNGKVVYSRLFTKKGREFVIGLVNEIKGMI